MEIKRFSEFLLEKDFTGEPVKEKIKEWEGTGPWFLEYISEVTDEKVRLTKEDVLKAAANLEKIETTKEAEELFQFAKYCIKEGSEKYKRTDVKVEEKDKAGNIIEKLVPMKSLKFGDKTLDKILSGGISKTTRSEIIEIYIELAKEKTGFIKEVPSDKSEAYKKVVEKLADFVIPPNSTSIDANIWVSKSEKDKIELDNAFKEYGKDKINLTIPLNPEKIKLILGQSELCISWSLAAIKQINSQINPATDEEGKKKTKALNEKIKEIEGDKGLDKIKKKNKEFLGEGDAKVGKAWDFWKEYQEKKDDEEKFNLIKADKKGIKYTDIEEYVKAFNDCRKNIIEVRGMVDDGKITKDEWYNNVVNYDQGEKNQDGKNKSKIEIGEGLKAAMYAKVKEGIGYLQDSIDNYCAAEGEKNALSQYLIAMGETVDRAKSKWKKKIEEEKEKAGEEEEKEKAGEEGEKEKDGKKKKDKK